MTLYNEMPSSVMFIYVRPIDLFWFVFCFMCFFKIFLLSDLCMSRNIYIIEALIFVLPLYATHPHPTAPQYWRSFHNNETSVVFSYS